MSTVTSTVYANRAVKSVHKGEVTVSGQYVAAGTTTTTAGDIVFLAKIPHGAIITEFRVDHSTGTSTFAVDYGLASGLANGGGAQMSIFASNLAKATIIRKNLLNASGTDRIQISCSASDPGRFGIFAAKILAHTSTTATPVINFSITYRNDDYQGL